MKRDSADSVWRKSQTWGLGVTKAVAIRLAVLVLASLAAAAGLTGCGSAPEITAAEQPLPKETLALLAKKGMTPRSPIFVRIFKEESELEVWKARDDNRFYHFKTYPICNWSGDLGPKQALGDRQAPEGFYKIKKYQLNPNSQFHVAFNLGYPNAYDRAHNRTGQAIMVHGKCSSAGCYAMTDALIEEIYALARESMRGEQTTFEVHAFPFRMTTENMERHKDSPWLKFWTVLKQGYDHFEDHRLPPGIAICERKYVVNVNINSKILRADQACPKFDRPMIEPFMPQPTEEQIAAERITMPGPKKRVFASTPLAPEAGSPVETPDQPVASGLGGYTFSGIGKALGFGL